MRKTEADREGNKKQVLLKKIFLNATEVKQAYQFPKENKIKARAVFFPQLTLTICCLRRPISSLRPLVTCQKMYMKTLRRKTWQSTEEQVKGRRTFILLLKNTMAAVFQSLLPSIVWYYAMFMLLHWAPWLPLVDSFTDVIHRLLHVLTNLFFFFFNHLEGLLLRT